MTLEEMVELEVRTLQTATPLAGPPADCNGPTLPTPSLLHLRLTWATSDGKLASPQMPPGRPRRPDVEDLAGDCQGT